MDKFILNVIHRPELVPEYINDAYTVSRSHGCGLLSLARMYYRPVPKVLC